MGDEAKRILPKDSPGSAETPDEQDPPVTGATCKYGGRYTMYAQNFAHIFKGVLRAFSSNHKPE